MNGMSKKLSKKTAPVVGRSCDIDLATSKRFVADGGYVFRTHRRKQELSRASRPINHNVAAIQGGIADLSDLDLIYATAGTAQGPSRSLNATQANDVPLDICLIGGFGFSPLTKEDL